MLLCQTAVCCPYVCNPHEIFAKNCNNFHGVNSIKLCISRVHRQKEKDFKFFLEVLFVIAHRFCCPCALLYIARKGMHARETLVGFPLHVKSPARRRPLLRSKSAALTRKTPLRVSFFGAGDEARWRPCRAATRTRVPKHATGMFFSLRSRPFEPLLDLTKKEPLS